MYILHFHQLEKILLDKSSSTYFPLHMFCLSHKRSQSWTVHFMRYLWSSHTIYRIYFPLASPRIYPWTRKQENKHKKVICSYASQVFPHWSAATLYDLSLVTPFASLYGTARNGTTPQYHPFAMFYRLTHSTAIYRQ